MTDLDIMQDDSEVVHYDRAGVPLYARTNRLAAYPNHQALCHWHEDIEFIHVLEGRMNYFVNGKKITLKENDCLMVNSRQLHYGFSYQREDCLFHCVLFHPCLFTGSRTLYSTYVLPILESRNLEYLYFDSAQGLQLDAAGLIHQIIARKEGGESGYEMEVVGLMHLFWGRLLRYANLLPQTIHGKDSPDLTLQKDMVSFIHQHYAEKITLADIAASGNVCRNKCCVIFRRYLCQSPIEFLNSYRLKVSCNLLASTSDSVTQIALSCGFNHLSYYSKLFLRQYGCTPSEFRDSLASL